MMNNVKWLVAGVLLYLLFRVAKEGSDMVQIRDNAQTEIAGVKFAWKGGIGGALFIDMDVNIINPTNKTMGITHPVVYVHAAKGKHLDTDKQIMLSPPSGKTYTIPANGVLRLDTISLKCPGSNLLKLFNIGGMAKALNLKLSDLWAIFKKGGLDEVFGEKMEAWGKVNDSGAVFSILNKDIWATAVFRANGLPVAMPSQIS